MAIGLDDALLGWIVASAGDRLLRLLRSDPAKKAMRTVVDEAITAAVAQVAGGLDDSRAGHLRASLLVHDIGVSDERVQVTNETELRDALHAWATALDHPEFGQPGYLAGLGLRPGELADALTSQIIGGIRRNGRSGGPLDPVATWLWRDEVSTDLGEIKTGVGEIRQRLSESLGAVAPSAPLGQPGGAPPFVPPPWMEPPLPPDFVVRPALGAQLVRALLVAADRSDDAEPVVLTGAGGFGKTQLAVWACQQAEVRERFAGVLWAELGQHQDEDDLARWLADLTVRLTGARRTYQTVSVAADAFAEALGDQRILLVVDDAWQAADVRPFLNGGPHTVRLVTTRRPLVVTGHEIRVDAMSPSEGAELLRLRLPQATTGELGPLLMRSGGWPLALALLGGALRSLHQRHAMTVRDAVGALVAGLDQYTIDELTDPGDGHSIKSTLSLSLNELKGSDPEALDRYVSLAAFSPGERIPSQLLERLWRMPRIRVLREFDRFIDRSLVVPGDADGIRLHEVIREELRRQFPDRARQASQALLDASRPAGGWHILARDDELWPRLAHHLIQGGRVAEMGEVLRDLRFLVARLDQGGPLALESGLRAYQSACPQDGYAGVLAAILVQDSHLLNVDPVAALTTCVIGDVTLFRKHLTTTDLAVTLHSRLAGHPEALTEIRHADEALPRHGLLAARPLPDRADPRLQRVLAGHRHYYAPRITWMPDGRLLSVSGGDHTLRIWDTKTGEQESVVPIPTDYVSGAPLSPDGRYLAVVGRDKDASPEKHGIRIVDVATGMIAAERPGLPGLSSGVCWGPDSATLAVARPGAVELWQPSGGAAPRALDAGPDGGTVARVAAWHPQAGLACVSFNGSLITWPDPTAGGAGDVWDLGLTPYRRYELAWRPDGRQLSIATGSELLIVEPARRHVAQRTSTNCAYQHAWRPDGTALAVSDLDTEGHWIDIWRQPRKQSANPDDAPYTPENGARMFVPAAGMAWHPAGDVMAVGIAGRIQLWRPVATTEPVTRPRRFESVSWQPGGELLAVVSEKREVLEVVNWAEPGRVIWAASTAREYWEHPVVWSPDGRFLVDDDENRIRIRDAATGEIVREMPAGHDDGNRNSPGVIRWPAPRLLMTSSSSGVALIDAENGREHASVPTRQAGDHMVNLLAVTADGSKLAVLRNLKELTVIDVPTGMHTTVDDSHFWLHYGSLGTFLPASASLLTTSGNELALWDIASRRIVAQTAWTMPYGIAADPDGAYIAAVNWQSHKIALFGARTLERLCELTVDGAVQRCAFDSSGQRLAVVGMAGLYLFHVRRGELGVPGPGLPGG